MYEISLNFRTRCTAVADCSILLEQTHSERNKTTILYSFYRSSVKHSKKMYIVDKGVHCKLQLRNYLNIHCVESSPRGLSASISALSTQVTNLYLLRNKALWPKCYLAGC